MRVTFFDVEYANTKNKSICQIGILSRDLDREGDADEKINLFVNPEDGFDNNCIRIHGITPSDVIDAPTFPKVWKQIERFFTNAVIIGHNVASADLDALQKNLLRYRIEMPEIYYVCTYRLARELVPSFVVPDYSLSSLCAFFEIPLPSEHNAFLDACACSDLLDSLFSFSKTDIEKQIERFVPTEENDFVAYISSASLKKDIHALYGMIRGFSMDSKISEQEIISIKQWRDTFAPYITQQAVQKIVSTIDAVLEDGVITTEEISVLQKSIREHLDVVSTSAVTLATQILNGIMLGIKEDEVINEEECQSLRTWLYENNYLAGHFPFDKLFEKIENVLADGIVSEDEANSIDAEINKLLNPVDALHNEVNSLKGKKVCLSGNFSFGQKSAVEQYILSQGGIVESGVTRSTDILVVGDKECQAYFNGTYGTKIKKAMEYNGKGSQIRISRESEVIRPGKSFCDVLFSFIEETGKSDADIYKAAGLTRQMMSKIRAQGRTGYIPSKSSICAFALALQLNFDQAISLLESAGYTLSRSFEMDRLVEEAIQKRHYNVDEINEKLYDAGLPCLGAK